MSGCGLRRFIRGLVLSVVVLVVISSAGQANAPLSTQMKQQFVQAAIGGAANAVQMKDVDGAKAYMLASAEMVMKMSRSDRSPQAKQLVQAWINMRAQLWPNAGQQADPAQLKAFIEAYNKVKMPLGKYGKAFNMFNIPSGQRAFWEHVATIHAEYQQAQKLVKELAAVAPPADQLVATPAVFSQVSPGMQAIFNIMYGPFLAYEQGQKRVIPEVVKFAEDNIIQAAAAKSPQMMLPQINALILSIKVLKNIDPKGAALPKIEAGYEQTVARMNKLYDEQIAQNRMPGQDWSGADAEALAKDISAFYKKMYPKDEILKVNLLEGGWQEGYERWWDDDVWLSAYARYCAAAIAVKQVDGNTRVFIETFRKTRNGDGSWSPLSKWRQKANYRILPENLDK